MPEQENLTHSEQVGVFYDIANALFHAIAGDTFHFGYWVDENDQSSFEEAQDHLTDLFIEQLAARPGSRVLDTGCGLGGPALRIAHTTHTHIVGVTISQEQVKIATAKAHAQGVSDQVTFQYADMTSLPYEQASFDSAFALESIMHVPDRVNALREIYRVLKPGARFVFSDFVIKHERSSQEKTMIESMGFLRFVTPDSLMESLRSVGFISANSLDLDQSNRRTIPIMIKRLQEHRDQLLRNKAMSADLLSLLEQALKETLSFEAQLGYLLVTAQKPAE